MGDERKSLPTFKMTAFDPKQTLSVAAPILAFWPKMTEH
jgi:hypothetical protein